MTDLATMIDRDFITLPTVKDLAQALHDGGAETGWFGGTHSRPWLTRAVCDGAYQHIAEATAIRHALSLLHQEADR